MASFELFVPRLALAGGFVVAAAAAPVVALLTTVGPAGTTVSACPSGEEEDLYTSECLPHTVPNSPASPFSSIPGNPDLPAINGIPCTGHNSGQCIGLSEDATQFQQPQTSVSSSP
ncbi:intersectin-EH binding protein Ibp1 [Mycolicibacterium fluoranthenivorans]|jgi:hypothetical protein|uniref:Intersectin-EH binding protein Ibp1 n=1 Tax=Mycolicibacterium fluoranthenivorans TaxID=258505 RepID=A0A1G4VJ65_9MYCO|nr:MULTISPECIES: intersectin-EH binding protein Ibp1 [Mycobacteriaceae]MCV7254064.1 intersectin-EH binding protein Ibp1 [Mycobacterium hackensackense]MCV7356266.1 intersectin-EH binding protein Ibp1 [Mycolicibacterium fluoranthenivorans]NIH97813.1 hypothetical protein [Mycolicibacterium fluoranthenivorans]QNJ92757.1 intersectin-EH binding protein Ibp1 [Mycolicibacterium fluoranthenivorans]SCX07573.1 hypothetical protein SAMN02799620_01049 [Mycolicibacterium fluoranthenivorans]